MSLMLDFYVISSHPPRRCGMSKIFSFVTFFTNACATHIILVHLIQMNERSQSKWANCSLLGAATMGAIIHTANPILALLMPTKMPRKSWAELFRIVFSVQCAVCVPSVSKCIYECVFTIQRGRLYGDTKQPSSERNHQTTDSQIELKKEKKEEKASSKPACVCVCVWVRRIVLHGKRESATHIKPK